jgi:hypothetical protein
MQLCVTRRHQDRNWHVRHTGLCSELCHRCGARDKTASWSSGLATFDCKRSIPYEHDNE